MGAKWVQVWGLVVCLFGVSACVGVQALCAILLTLAKLS